MNELYITIIIQLINGMCRHVLKWDSIGKEIMGIALPAALGVAADPLASLIDTAFIGHIGTYIDTYIHVHACIYESSSMSSMFQYSSGAVELAAAGVSIALFNQASRITIFPLVSITTSFVAQEDTMANMAQSQSQDCEKATQKPNHTEKRHIASASTALIFGVILGLLQAIFLIFMATTLLGVMGVKHVRTVSLSLSIILIIHSLMVCGYVVFNYRILP